MKILFILKRRIIRNDLSTTIITLTVESSIEKHMVKKSTLIERLNPNLSTTHKNIGIEE